MDVFDFIIVFLLFIFIDGIWLFSMRNTFKRFIGYLMRDSILYIPAIVFYVLYAVGTLFFVVYPSHALGVTNFEVFLRGMFFGVVAYGAYDLTNHATLKQWPLRMTILDMFWGSLLTGLVSLIGAIFIV